MTEQSSKEHEGTVEIMKELSREKKRNEKIAAAVNVQPDMTEAVLAALYAENGGNGVLHSDLSKVVGISSRDLTDIMRRILESYAATAAKKGNGTSYMLTRAGRRYCEGKINPAMTKV